MPRAVPVRAHCASATYVYKRTGAPCVLCGTAIEQTVDGGGRQLYWCPTCQAD